MRKLNSRESKKCLYHLVKFVQPACFRFIYHLFLPYFRLSMYNKSGNELISLFVTTQIAQSSIKLGDLSSYGILNVQLELKQQGQKARLGVRINSAVGLKWMMNGFKPYVDCCLLGPGLQNVKHRQATKSKANTLSPKFNEIYQFVFGSKDHPISQYELQFILKDYRAFLNV